ncbi:methylated-DNA--[protein]-cysteine S-methyltransferase [Kineococcus sp. T13]|uniref:methylated-DNA--[protein]-cysteine S-methyltransferase n=1 Tax=Kineococcus vitellinus TaxID=2696565 RepID=UPI00141275AA|nr:methylated-DNA--[protein]-cysteine S-methyltransferase [Kineococcus vitellinus]
MRWTVLESPVGELTAARSGDGLVGVWFADHRGGVPLELHERDDGAFEDLRGQLAQYFAGERTRFELPLAPRGDAFSRRVWAALREIPHGQTRSYGELARALGGPGYAQAVGLANGRNPLSIVVPCHRVVGADGALTGYAGGLWRKRFLLSLEEPAADEAGRLF